MFIRRLQNSICTGINDVTYCPTLTVRVCVCITWRCVAGRGAADLDAGLAPRRLARRARACAREYTACFINMLPSKYPANVPAPAGRGARRGASEGAEQQEAGGQAQGGGRQGRQGQQGRLAGRHPHQAVAAAAQPDDPARRQEPHRECRAPRAHPALAPTRAYRYLSTFRVCSHSQKHSNKI